MSNKKYEIAQLDDNTLIAELKNNNGEHPEVVICLRNKNGMIFQNICLVRQHKTENDVMDNDRLDCLVWAETGCESYTHKFVIGVEHEENV